MRSRRFLIDRLYFSFTYVAVAIAIVPLLVIIGDVVYKGIAAINVDFFTMLPPPPCFLGSKCIPGGMGDAIQGTLILVALASAIGIPVGVLSGVYVTEYGSDNLYGSSIRFLGDVLAGIPSIVTGVLAYELIVIPLHGYSFIAGGVALGSIMIPIVSNTSAEALKAVPNSLREASHALGVKNWRVAILMLGVAKRSIATACLLAIGRITGETAPLLLSAGISELWYSGLTHPAASLTYYIFYFATSPYNNWRSLAWGAAFILVVIVMGINLAVRITTRGKRVYA